MHDITQSLLLEPTFFLFQKQLIYSIIYNFCLVAYEVVLHETMQLLKSVEKTQDKLVSFGTYYACD